MYNNYKKLFPLLVKEEKKEFSTLDMSYLVFLIKYGVHRNLLYYVQCLKLLKK